MRKINIVLVGAAAACIPSTALMAQTFEGPFVGVQAGLESKELDSPSTEVGTITLDDDQQAFTGGIYAGYDMQIAPRIVIGAEASFDLSAEDEMIGSNAAGAITLDPDWSIDLTGRAGYLIGDKTLAYLRGGYTNARVELTQDTPLAQISQGENRDGWLAGAGVEHRFGPNLSARVEYRYSDLSEGDKIWDRHRVLTGLSWRF